MSSIDRVPSITLNDGRSIPQLGFGVFQIPLEETKDATAVALDVGYRHIDTAELYGNEAGVGEAVAASGVDREDVFVTSKLNNKHLDFDGAVVAGRQSARDLGGYVDLFLIHWPLTTISDFLPRWRALEQLQKEGVVRSIGVSNFQSAHLDRLLSEAEIEPAVNQIEVHPYLVQEELRRYDRDHGLVTEAWSPLAQGLVLDDATIVRVAESAGRTPAQVVLRWHLQRGDVVFPKSVTRARVEQNFEVFDFDLSDDDMAAITALDRGHRTGPDPDSFDFVPE
ncbi:aldo/keto reductase [Isoptericola aurantiacus]|uniref:aldo/keto reductase n=1 Tax=Isoptericola aurantiacus TaxID=3377839 RepID=UPI00383BD849